MKKQANLSEEKATQPTTKPAAPARPATATKKNKVKGTIQEAVSETDESFSDGSGGAFAGTEEVRE